MVVLLAYPSPTGKRTSSTHTTENKKRVIPCKWSYSVWNVRQVFMNPYQSETDGWKMSFCILLVSFCCVWSVQNKFVTLCYCLVKLTLIRHDINDTKMLFHWEIFVSATLKIIKEFLALLLSQVKLYLDMMSIHSKMLFQDT